MTALAGRVTAAPDALTELAALRALKREVQARTSACVQRARADGASWAAVAEQLGCTRQAAAQRFAPARPPAPASPPPAGPTPAANEPDHPAAASTGARDAAPPTPPPAAPGRTSPAPDGQAAPAPDRAGALGLRRRRRPQGGQGGSVAATFDEHVAPGRSRQEWLMTTPGGRPLLRAFRVGPALRRQPPSTKT